jgi:phage tail protein X
MGQYFWNASTFNSTYHVLCQSALLENEPGWAESGYWLPEGLTFDLQLPSEYNTLTRPRQLYERMEVDPVEEPISFGTSFRSPILRPSRLNWQTC